MVVLMVLNTLCEFCDSIKFGALGFHDIPPPTDVKSDYLGFCEETLGENAEEWMNGRERPLGEILDGAVGWAQGCDEGCDVCAKACDFCGKVAEYFRYWSTEIMKEKPDIQNCLASFRFDARVCEPKGVFFRFWVIFEVRKSSADGDIYSSVMQFQKCNQKCNQQLLKVEDFCSGRSLFDWEKSVPEQAFSGRIRPLIVDTQLCRKWKETCVEKHDSCRSSFTGERPPWLRLIDVERRCVVDCFFYEEKGYCVGDEVGISYVALSYVWGKYNLIQCKKVMPELDNSTENQFREPRSLTREMVLSTIDDAIVVTQGLGEKYLWVDCLCIRQDDEADQGKFIPHMDLIYGIALVTIVAASGVDADAGLPGVNSDSPTRCEQMPFLIKGESLLQTLDGEWKTWAGGYRYLADSLWCKRGWTLQEKIFSQRALIFTPKQTYWECQKATWCEDGVWETESFPTCYRHCFGDGNNGVRPWSSVDEFRAPSYPYPKLVQEFSRRALTYNSDVLDAFDGILSALEREVGQHFIWALPTSFLGEALLWSCFGSSKRRLDFDGQITKCAVRFLDGQIKAKCDFPSWSWLGWMGEFGWPGFYQKVNPIFYYLDYNGALVQALGDRNDDPRTKITREQIPKSVLTLNIASNILFFWSYTADLHLENGVNQFGNDTQFLSCHGEHFQCEILGWDQQPEPDLGHDELAEFIVIGNCGFDDIFLLCIDRKDTGVAYRRGLVRVVGYQWNLSLSDNLVWKMICLG